MKVIIGICVLIYLSTSMAQAEVVSLDCEFEGDGSVFMWSLDVDMAKATADMFNENMSLQTDDVTISPTSISVTSLQLIGSIQMRRSITVNRRTLMAEFERGFSDSLGLGGSDTDSGNCEIMDRITNNQF